MLFLSVVFSWVVMQCSLVGGYQCFGGTYHLYLLGISEDGGDMFL
jgi:hypothetical protein